MAKNLEESHQNSPSPAVKPYFAKKVKRALFFKLSIGAAPFSFLLVPLVVQASVFSFFTVLLERGAPAAGASTLNANSQTMELLQPAVNINPNPQKGGGNIALADGVALVPTESPSGASSGAAEPRSSQISVYMVREGDTLTQIAEMFDVSVNTIVWANDIKGRSIRPGQELIILPVTGIRHIVQKGDTLSSVAKKYESDAEEIARYNELEAGAPLIVGDPIIIPNGVMTVPKTAHALPVHSAAAAQVQSTVGFTNPLPGSIKTQGIHGYNGVDLGGVPSGSPVLAAQSGAVLVAKAAGWNGGYGSYVVIDHGGMQTLYAHLSTVSVSVGQRVEAGERIGGVGSTGRSTGVHLHFEVRGAPNPFK